ncbi:hypothetical protein EOM39_05950 [Candidatus Gracilibacteria bacterium]|nr:hypothetical protein [Candidatus Gracilibacteria bacterium]
MIKFFKNLFLKDKIGEISEGKKINHADYIDYRNYLIRQKHNVSDKESKLLIYLSAGVLSFSVAFIEKNDTYELAIFIIISWIFAISSLILLLITFNYSKKSFEKQIEITDRVYENEITDNKNKKDVPENKDIKKVKKGVFFARLFLILSIIILFIFYSINLLKNV